MKKLMLIGIAGILSVLSAHAQLGKYMSKYHDKDGIAVSQLDKSLYGLYLRENAGLETREMLRQLEEINLLNLDLNVCAPDLGDKIVTQFRNILDHPDKYRLVKSQKNGAAKQLIYIRNKQEKITDLVVWNQTPDRLDLIELRGDIQPERVASLGQALNLPGLHALAALSDTPADEKQISMEERFRSAAKNLQHLGNGWPDRMMDLFEDFPFPDMKFPDIFKDDGNSMSSSSSVQIIEENGKTKVKIDSQNTDIIYIIDGQEAPKDSVQMPENIRNVQLLPSRQEPQKTYLFITSQEKIGQFISFKEGELTFRHNDQEFKYNLDKLQAPILIIDGRPSSVFDMNPSHILQIRPISQAEKEAGFYPDAEVIINTRNEW